MKQSTWYLIFEGIAIITMGFCLFEAPDQVILWGILANIMGLHSEVLNIKERL